MTRGSYFRPRKLSISVIIAQHCVLAPSHWQPESTDYGMALGGPTMCLSVGVISKS